MVGKNVLCLGLWPTLVLKAFTTSSFVFNREIFHDLKYDVGTVGPKNRHVNLKLLKGIVKGGLRIESLWRE